MSAPTDTKAAQVSRWLGDDVQFKHELAAGHAHARPVAHRLLEDGFTVQFPPSRVRDHVSQRGHWSQDVDLWTGRECLVPEHEHAGPGRLPIEIKSRGIAFTTRDDYPYPTAM